MSASPSPPQGGLPEERALWQACTDGNLEAFHALMAEYPALNVNWADSEFRRTPLYRACGFGRDRLVEQLLAHPEIDVNRSNLNGATPLNISCQQGHVDVVTRLLADPRVKVNAANEKQASPLYKACQQGHTELVKMLLADKRVDILKKMEGGFSPLYIACHQNKAEVVKLLMEDGRSEVNGISGTTSMSPFFIACHQGSVECAKLLLAYPSVDLTRRNWEGNTPFMVACLQNRPEVVKLLIRVPDIGINEPNLAGQSPIEAAVQKGNVEVVKWLLWARDDSNPTVQAHTQAAAALAAYHPRSDVREVMVSYVTNVVRFRRTLRLELGISASQAAETFALAVFYCDDHLRLKPTHGHSPEGRFFRILKSLHLDTQMVLCNRMYDVMDQSYIPKALKDEAFIKITAAILGGHDGGQE